MDPGCAPDFQLTLIAEDLVESNRQRMVFECHERLKKAIRMRAALDGLRPSGVILAALSRHLDAELAVVDQR